MTDAKDKKSKLVMQHENHAKPRTRREFMAQGFFGATGTVMVPGLLQLLIENRAFAASCAPINPANNSPRMAGFMVFDLAGGAGIAGSNVIVGKRGGQQDFLNSYTSLGLPAGMHPSRPGQINTQLGLAFHADSGFLRGILATTSPATRANIEGVIFAATSNDDTANNPHNPVYWVNKAGLDGKLTSIIGSMNTLSGGRSEVPVTSIDAAKRPVKISRPADVMQLINAGKLATLLSPADVQKIMRATNAMSAKRLAMFQEKDLPSQIKELVECGYINSVDLLNKFDPAALDPAADSDVTALFSNLANDTDQQKTAAVSKLIIDGIAGSGTVTLTGYDYHDATRATGEAKDFAAGQLIGRTLELAARKRQDLMIYVFTDGAVASNGTLDNSAEGRGKGIWTADSGQRSATFALVYKKDGKPSIRNTRRQIGAFSESGGVDLAAGNISSDVNTLTKALVANYLALHGQEGRLAEVVGDNPFGANLSQYLLFNKLR